MYLPWTIYILNMCSSMDIILASSRGKGLEPLIKNRHPSPSTVHIYSTSSASIHTLTNQATSIIQQYTDPHNCHIYIIGGYCDLNEIIQHRLPGLYTYRGGVARHQEFIFRETAAQAITRITKLISEMSEHIKSLHALPVICTIPPSSLTTWNHIRLKQHKTSLLTHYKQYQHMQQQLITAIVEINKNIIAINHSNHVHTPKLADTILTKPGKNKNHRCHYGRLVDGVHPTEAVKEDWAIKLTDAMCKNRATPETTREIFTAQSSCAESDSGSDPDDQPRTDTDTDEEYRRDWKTY